MNTLASTSTACYTCVRARASGSNAAGFARFSTTRRNHRKDELWSVDKVRSHNELQTRDLLTELARMQKEDGVKVDKSVFGTEIGGKKIYPRAEPVVKPHWRLHRESLKEKFPEGWNPPRRLSRGEMNTIRRLHALDPIQFSTPKLADQFKISVEAVRRILKSKFRTEEEIEEEKIGDALLQEADLGTYDKSQGLPPRSSRLLPDYEEDKPKYADRKTKPAKPIQEGFHASKLSSEYKWAAGQRSNLVNPSPMFRTRKWEGSGRSRFDRTLRPTGDTSEEGEEESRATFRRQEQAS